MTFDKDYKKSVQKRLKGVYGIGDIFNMMNQGASIEDVEKRITQMLESLQENRIASIEYNPTPVSYTVFGKPLISQNAIDDMNAIMRLPYAVKGALMPDAHRTAEGHTPVGAVVLTDADKLVPDIVSADIACSVTLTVFNKAWDESLTPRLEYLLKTKMFFGVETNPDSVGKTRPYYANFPTLHSELGKSIQHQLLGMSVNQFGTSGDGNHFGEFGVTNHGQLALLTHYGSRGVGALIHKVFNDWAKTKTITPNSANTPLDTNTPEGADYMALLAWAGEYTFDSHQWLSEVMTRELKSSCLDFIHSRHNFAWYDEATGGWIHRKGATPVHKGERGVIPATMGHNTKIVMGLGNPQSLNSTSHGGGRTHSRGRALQEFGGTTHDYVKKEFGITLIGADADEDPRAYKSIEDVVQAQQDCATVIGEFTPKVVRMAYPRFFKR